MAGGTPISPWKVELTQQKSCFNPENVGIINWDRRDKMEIWINYNNLTSRRHWTDDCLLHMFVAKLPISVDLNIYLNQFQVRNNLCWSG